MRMATSSSTRPGMTSLSTCTGGRRPKSAKARNRGGWGTRRCRGRYGDLVTACDPKAFSDAVSLDSDHNFDVAARALLIGESTFRPSRDFKELRVAKISHFATSTLCTLYPHRPNRHLEALKLRPTKNCFDLLLYITQDDYRISDFGRLVVRNF